MFNRISFEKLLEVTAEDLAVIKDNLGAVYMDETIEPGVKDVMLAEAFNTVDHWSSYFSRFKDIQDSKLEELSNENARLVGENKKLNDELDDLISKLNKCHGKIGMLQERLVHQERLIETKNSSSNLVSIDLVEMIEKLETIASSYESAIKAAEHKAAMKTFNQRVASGDVKPAKRADISDEYIIEMYNNNVSAYKIAQSVGMTQQAILYRIKKLKEAGLIE